MGAIGLSDPIRDPIYIIAFRIDNGVYIVLAVFNALLSFLSGEYFNRSAVLR